MKNPFRILVPVMCAGMLSTLHAKEAGPAWTVRANHENALYQTGETATFTITLGPDSKVAPDAELFWTMSKDGVDPKTHGKVKLQAGKATVTGKLDVYCGGYSNTLVHKIIVDCTLFPGTHCDV